MRKKITLLLVTGLLLMQQINAQLASRQAMNDFQQHFRFTANQDWIEAMPNSNGITYQEFFTRFANVLGLTTADEMKFVRQTSSEDGLEHKRYQQYHNQYLVDGGEFILHVLNGNVVTANGKLLRNFAKQTPSLISENDALKTAMNLFPKGDFMWLNAKANEMIKESKKDPSATYYPKGELVWRYKRYNTDFNKQDFVLCWRFDIYTESGDAKAVFIDAEKNSCISDFPLAAQCSAGTGVSTWNGTINLNTHYYGSPQFQYVMWDDCGNPGLVVRNGNNCNCITSWTDYVDGNNVWDAGVDQPVVQTYFGELMHYSMIYSNYGWWSYDNAGTWVVAYNNVQPFGTVNNACQNCYGQNEVTFGDGSTSANTDNWNTDDIVGHEITHGVYRFAVGWNYNSEPGALNESFSDIFGEMTEQWAEGNMDWLVGADRGAIRSFSNPNSYSDYAGVMPDTYNGTGWYSGTADNSGVHHNSSVQNYWYYLLSNGGSGTNDNSDPFSCGGIGTAAAGWITFYAYRDYMTTSANYIDARQATIQQAISGYGSCSYAANETGKAWYAVGVGPASSVYDWTVCGSYAFPFTLSFAGIEKLHGGGGCTTDIIGAGYSVYFYAGKEVILSPGFTAYAGCDFYAYINDCAYDAYKTSNPPLLASTQNSGARPPVLFTQLTNPDLVSNPKTKDVKFTLSPNPTSDITVLNFITDGTQKVTIDLYDMDMKLVKSIGSFNSKLGSNDVQINLTGLEAGVYFVKMSDEQSSAMERLVFIRQ